MKNYFLFILCVLMFNSVCLAQENSDSAKDIPFAVIENVPVYPGCIGDNASLKLCMNVSIQEHVRKNFNPKTTRNIGLSSGKHRIYVSFKITTKGKVKVMSVRAPHPDIEVEAMRVVHRLPKMKPGMQDGKPVNVTYLLPISFNVN